MLLRNPKQSNLWFFTYASISNVNLMFPNILSFQIKYLSLCLFSYTKWYLFNLETPVFHFLKRFLFSPFFSFHLQELLFFKCCTSRLVANYHMFSLLISIYLFALLPVRFLQIYFHPLCWNFLSYYQVFMLPKFFIILLILKKNNILFLFHGYKILFLIIFLFL